MSNLIDHARRELAAIGMRTDDPEERPNKWIAENVLELINVFRGQGHSGMSAPYCVEVFRKVALLEPLSPLTGADDEWNEVDDDTWQNKRCAHVFKNAAGEAYDIEGRIFRDPNGVCYTSHESHVAVTFPYVPKREYVDVEGGQSSEEA